MAESKTEADVEGSVVELCVDGAVVSLSAIAELTARLDGVRRLMVRRKAVVTPAVRDLLRQRKIELAFRTEAAAEAKSKNGNGSHQPAVPQLVIGMTGTSCPQVDLLFKLLSRAALAIERLAPTGLVELIDDLARRLASSATTGVLLTSEPAAAVCISNRLAGVRAMAAGDAGTLTALGATAKAIGANLLIVDPAGRGPFAMKQLIDRFCQALREHARRNGASV